MERIETVSEFLFKPGQKLVMIGDSITDCGRRSGPNAPYGSGYVSMVRNLLIAQYPGHGLAIVNRGSGGNTVRDLADRWEQDVIDEAPDVLSVKIGINDVWRHVAGRMDEHVPLEEYESTLRELLRLTRDTVNPQLILIDPYVLETDRSDPFRAMMDEYIKCVHGLATEFDAVSVRTQEAFDRALAQQPSEFWAGDRVHPQPFGHAVIALAFLKAVGFEL